MSFILDALKRSERARRVLGAADAPPTPMPATARRGWALGAVTLLLLANAALLAWFLLRSPPDVGPPGAVAPQGEVRPLSREAGGDAAVAAAAGPLAAAPGTAVEATPAVAAIPLVEAPPALRDRLAALHVDVHGWADDPAQRFVLINLKRRAVGDALDGGATLVEIVPDGVVVELDGRRVLLPRQ